MFAVNQFDTDSDLNGGKTLSDTLDLSVNTLVRPDADDQLLRVQRYDIAVNGALRGCCPTRNPQVILDKTGLPLRRLWCLFEISETPPVRHPLQSWHRDPHA